MATIIGYATAQLSGDVTMTNANTWYNGPSLSLGAGTWMLSGAALVLGTTVAQDIVVRISDGTNHYASAQFSHGNAVQHAAALSLPRVVVTLAATTTVKVQAASTAAGCSIKAATTSNGSGNNATWITAERVA